MIHFLHLRYKNFFSVGNHFVEFELDSCSLTLFQGKSGTGKSTFLEALCIGLFNRPFDGNLRKKSGVINKHNKKDCVVEIEFKKNKDHFLIRRGLKPNLLDIEINGEMRSKSADMKEDQKWIESQILQMNFDAFKQIVCIGIADFKPFLELSAGDRRKFVEKVLDIEVFSEMTSYVKEELSSIKENQRMIGVEIDSCGNSIGILEDNLASLTNRSEGNTERLEQELQDISKEGKELSKIEIKTGDPEKVKQAEEKLKIAKKKISSCEANAALAKREIHQASSDLKFYENNDKCSECGQVIDDDFKQTRLKEITVLLEERKKDLEKLSKVSEKFSENSGKLEAFLQKVRENESAVVRLKEKQNSLRQKYKRVREDLQRIQEQGQEDLEPLKEKISKWEEKLKGLEEKNDKVEKRLEVVQTTIRLLKDDGIKACIVSHYVPLINKYINDFIKSLNFFATVTLDENFQEEIIYRGGDGYEYGNLSMGERQRLNIAILFMWREIALAKSSVVTNFLVIDEIADSSLDSDAAMNVIDFFRSEQFKGTSLFLISHKNDIDAAFDRVFRFELKGNFTSIKEEKC